MWWVNGVNVWGTVSSMEANLLITIKQPGSSRIVFASIPVGGEVQQIEYKDLTDTRGNRLPEELNNPRVIAVSKNDIGVVVQGAENSKSFTLAKTRSTDLTATADLLIVEMG
jgi:hypothetical protein